MAALQPDMQILSNNLIPAGQQISPLPNLPAINPLRDQLICISWKLNLLHIDKEWTLNLLPFRQRMVDQSRLLRV